MPFRVSLNTPLIPSLAPFSQCIEPLYLHPATTQILDDMRFLIGLVLALPEDPSEKELQKVQNTAVWIHDRITNLPPEAPAPTQQHRGSECLLSPHPNDPSNSSSSARRASSGGDPWQPSAPSGPADPEGLHTHSLPSPAPSHPGTPSASCGSSTQDLTYQAVRGTALIYARAIAQRRPLRDAATRGGRDGDGEDLVLRVWTTIWRVPLRAWRAVLGVFVWVALSIAPASCGAAHGRLVKSLLAVGLAQMGMEDWEVAEAGMQGALKLVAWLAGGKGGRRGTGGGGGGGGGGERGRKDKERAELGVVVDPALFVGRRT